MSDNAPVTPVVKPTPAEAAAKVEGEKAEKAPPVEGAPAAEGTSAEPAKVEEPVKPEPVSPHFARIKKEEARLRAEREALKKEREGWDSSKSEREADAKLRAADPMAWLKKQGLTYDQITELALNGKIPEVAKEEPVHPEVAKVREELAAMKAEREKELDAREQRQIAAYREHVGLEVKAAGEKFELVNADPNGVETVWALIEAHAKEAGKILSPIEAAELVEAEMEAQLETRWKPVLTSKKASAKLAIVANERASQPAASESGPRRAAPTLSPSLAAPAPSGVKRPPTRQELAERAAAELDARKRQRDA